MAIRRSQLFQRQGTETTNLKARRKHHPYNHPHVTSAAHASSAATPSSYSGPTLAKIIASSSLFAPFIAYSHLPLSFWLQWAYAYGVRLCLLWSVMSLILIGFRFITDSTVHFVTELYVTTFWYTLSIFGLLCFPTFTLTFLSLAAAYLSLVTIVDQNADWDED